MDEIVVGGDRQDCPAGNSKLILRMRGAKVGLCAVQECKSPVPISSVSVCKVLVGTEE